MGTQNGVATPKNASKSTPKNGQKVDKGATKEPIVKTEEAKAPEKAIDAALLVKERLEKKTKLDTMYEDIDQLENLKKDFESIQSSGDVRITITCNGQTKFSTHREDTVQGVLQSVEGSINAKLEKAYKDLAQFQF